eukprot:2834321-Pleurochrysis_carterae.AAC.1
MQCTRRKQKLKADSMHALCTWKQRLRACFFALQTMVRLQRAVRREQRAERRRSSCDCFLRSGGPTAFCMADGGRSKQ